MRKSIQISDAPAPVGSYSQALLQDDWLIISGQICIDPHNGKLQNENITSETHQVMKNIAALLHEVNMSFEDVVKCSLYIQNMDDFTAINEIYASYLFQPYPARECIEVSQLPKGAQIEIAVWAQKKL